MNITMQRIEKISLSTDYPIGPVNVYLIFGEKITLIDAGIKTEQAWKQFNDGLHNIGLDLCDLDQVVLTHHHEDHVGLLEWILERNPVPVYAHKYTQRFHQDEQYLDRSKEFFERFFYEFGLSKKTAKKWAFYKANHELSVDFSLKRVLKEGDMVPGLSGWEVIETPGHSQDHISLYRAREKTLICGDNLIKGSHVGLFIDAPFNGEERAKPLIQYIANLNKCLELPVNIAYSGHGTNIYSIEDVINSQKARTKKRIIRLKDALAKSKGVGLTGLDIVKEMYPSKYKDLLISLVSEVISVLDLLVDCQEVIVKNRNGVNRYSLV